MVNQRPLPDFQLANGDGIQKPFPEYLTDFNILALRHVPVPSHGPPTKLLRSLLADHRGAKDQSVRGFDIRSPDQPCETCGVPHIVSTGPDLVTICDCDGSIFRKFGVVEGDRFFVVTSACSVIDVGSIEDLSRWSALLDMDGDPSQHGIARAPPDRKQAEPSRGGVETMPQPCRSSS